MTDRHSLGDGNLQPIVVSVIDSQIFLLKSNLSVETDIFYRYLSKKQRSNKPGFRV